MEFSRPLRPSGFAEYSVKTGGHQDPRRTPKLNPPVSKQTAKPLFPVGRALPTKTQAPGASPPMATPCRTRMNRRSTGAATQSIDKLAEPNEKGRNSHQQTLSVNMRFTSTGVTERRHHDSSDWPCQVAGGKDTKSLSLANPSRQVRGKEQTFLSLWRRTQRRRNR